VTAQTALVLAGHGSHISPLTAGLVWRYVDILRQQGVADEITACFWKEQPSFFEVLDSVAADDITIVPVFTAQGYFTRTVIPAEVNLDGTITRRDGRTIRYGKTLGEHHGLADVVYQRAVKTLTHYDLGSPDTTVANSAITYGANRVIKWQIKEVRYYDVWGNLIATDSSPHVVHERPVDDN